MLGSLPALGASSSEGCSALPKEQRGPHDAFEDFLRYLQQLYGGRAAAAAAAAVEHLSGVAEWEAPAAGMFMWFKLTGAVRRKRLLGEQRT
jgi:DNA-binding transcriptional MocR family regulator